MFDSKFHETLKNFDLLLASTSPRRLEILRTILKLENVKVVPSQFEENIEKQGLHYIEYVQQTSLGKAKAVESQLDTSSNKQLLILSADTVIVCNGIIYEKPGNKERQRQMFADYAANPILEVVTSVNVINCKSRAVHTLTEATKLYFDIHCPSHLIDAYIDSGEGLQVAGGFKYQSIGNLLFSKLEGDYFNVVGLPAKGCYTLLEKALS